MWSLSPPLTSISKKGSSGFLSWWVWSLSHRTKQQVEWDAGWGKDSLSGAGSKRMQKQVARCLSCSEIGDTELYGSVVPRGFGCTETIRPVRPSSSQRKHLSPQLTRQVRSHKDLQGINWKICKELDARNAEQKRNQDEVFLKGETNMHGKKMQEHRKEHKRTSSRIGRRQSHLC